LCFPALDTDVLKAFIAEIKVANVDGLIVRKNEFEITHCLPQFPQESIWLNRKESHSCHKCHKPNPMSR